MSEKAQMQEQASEEGEIEKQPCPFCHEKAMVLTEREMEVPYFGRVYIFAMTCSSCKYHKADVESVEQREPTKVSIDISGEEDMKIRIVKSSEATVKIPHIVTITPGPASQGYVTNVEGILRRVKSQIEAQKETEEDADGKKAAWKLIKKLNRVMWGQEKIKMIIEDPSGNSAIISDKAQISSMKKQQ